MNIAPLNATETYMRTMQQSYPGIYDGMLMDVQGNRYTQSIHGDSPFRAGFTLHVPDRPKEKSYFASIVATVISIVTLILFVKSRKTI